MEGCVHICHSEQSSTFADIFQFWLYLCIQTRNFEKFDRWNWIFQTEVSNFSKSNTFTQNSLNLSQIFALHKATFMALRDIQWDYLLFQAQFFQSCKKENRSPAPKIITTLTHWSTSLDLKYFWNFYVKSRLKQSKVTLNMF